MFKCVCVRGVRHVNMVEALKLNVCWNQVKTFKPLQIQSSVLSTVQVYRFILESIKSGLHSLFKCSSEESAIFFNIRVSHLPHAFSMLSYSHQPAASRAQSRTPRVAYLPLPEVLDMSLSVWSLFHQLNVTLSSSAVPRKVLSLRLVWHECAPECTAGIKLQNDRKHQTLCHTCSLTQNNQSAGFHTSCVSSRRENVRDESVAWHCCLQTSCFHQSCHYLCINGADSRSLQGQAL